MPSWQYIAQHFSRTVVHEFLKTDGIDNIIKGALYPPTVEESIAFFKSTALLKYLGEENFKLLYEEQVMYGKNPNSYKQGIRGLYRSDDRIREFFEQKYLTVPEFIELFKVNALSLNMLLMGNEKRLKIMFDLEKNYKDNLLKIRNNQEKQGELLMYLDPEYGIAYEDEDIERILI